MPKGIGFYPNRYANPADLIYVMSAEGNVYAGSGKRLKRMSL